jgi:hypothetical protein
LENVYQSVSKGIALDDSLRGYIAKLQSEREECLRLVTTAERWLKASSLSLTPDKLGRFSTKMREVL